MVEKKQQCIIIFGRNVFECQALIFFGWLRRLKLLAITQRDYSVANNALSYAFFIRRYAQAALKPANYLLGDYEGVYYATNKETIDLAVNYYDQHIRNKSGIIDNYNMLLKTNKFEAYIKKQLSFQIFPLLEDLHLVRLSGLLQNEILMVKNSLNEFVIKYMEDVHKVQYRIRWVPPSSGLFSLAIYYLWLVKEFFRRGTVFNKARKKYKISREAAMGFYRRTLRDDVFIDNNQFKIRDMLILEFDPSHDDRVRAFEEARQIGFDTASIPNLEININKNIFHILTFYFYQPVKSYLRLFLKRQSSLFYYLFKFHRECFPIEILMNLYDIKCHISSRDWGDVETTIIFNKYGTKNIIFHWSDLAIYMDYGQAFIAHNIYFAWGDAHYECCSVNNFVNKKINIGCIFKKEYKNALKRREDIIRNIKGLNKNRKIVTFFDTSFDRGNSCYNECFFLEYLELMLEFSKRYINYSVLLKPKIFKNYDSSISSVNYERYKKLRDELANVDNFIHIDPFEWNFEDILAVSDVSVSMGMNSPATIALICGRDGFYFDITGNDYHPFAVKYRNVLVFDNKDLLCRRIEAVLNKKFSCRQIVSEDEIRRFDAFADDNAMERVRRYLCDELTSSG